MQLAITPPAPRLEAPLPLEMLTERLTQEAQLCYDHAGVRLGDTALAPDGLWQFDGAGGLLSRHALGQLCARLPLPDGGLVPARYLARCPSLLAALNLNYWLATPAAKEQRVRVRVREAKDGSPATVRAILSERYVPVDHPVLLATLRELAPRHHLTVAAWSRDESQLTLRLLVPTDHPASHADPFRVGVHVSNSEVGRGAVRFSALITRLICTNGLIVQVAELGSFQRRHLGRVDEDLAPTIAAALPRVLAAAEQAGARFAQLREQPAPRPVATFVARTARQLELSQAAAEATLARLDGESLYAVVNAFTLAAHAFPVAERVRVEMALSRFLRAGPLNP